MWYNSNMLEATVIHERVPKPANFEPERYKESGALRCLAWSNNNGRQCENSPIKGKNVCHSHGGKLPSGVAAGAYRHGRYSEALKGALAHRYEEARANPQILSLRDDIALLDVRLAELAQSLLESKLSVSQSELRRLSSKLNKAIATKDIGQIQSRADSLNQAIQQSATQSQSWLELADLMLKRKKLVESERKALVQSGLMMSAEESLNLMARILEILHRNIEDKGILRVVQAEFERLAE